MCGGYISKWYYVVIMYSYFESACPWVGANVVPSRETTSRAPSQGCIDVAWMSYLAHICQSMLDISFLLALHNPWFLSDDSTMAYHLLCFTPQMICACIVSTSCFVFSVDVLLILCVGFSSRSSVMVSNFFMKVINIG
jgi:hypothetical protein